MSKQGIYAGDTHSFRTVRRYNYASQGPGEPVLGIHPPPDDVAGGSGILSSGTWLRASASPTDHLTYSRGAGVLPAKLGGFASVLKCPLVSVFGTASKQLRS